MSMVGGTLSFKYSLAYSLTAGGSRGSPTFCLILAPPNRVLTSVIVLARHHDEGLSRCPPIRRLSLPSLFLLALFYEKDKKNFTG